jgi:hypothetical protein
MSNEQYLIVSYFAIGALVLAIAVLTYLWLKRGFAGIADSVPQRPLGVVLKRLFLIGIVLPSLVGFFSVSFKTCGTDTYAKVIADRAYLVAKNREQVTTSLNYIIAALIVWGLILLVPLAIIKRSKPTSGG